MKEYLIGRLTSTNAWVAVIMIPVLLLLPKSIALTLLVVYFFVPDGLVNSLIMKYAPDIQKKLIEWSK